MSFRLGDSTIGDPIFTTGNWGVESWRAMTTREDIASVAGQLAGLTRTVEEMADELHTLQKGAANQQERSNAQQERIDIAARELAEVSARLQAAASALRQAF